ncbi:MAG: HTH domain-containing protein, partial [Sphingopyxis sp.]|nr:HTH domain-containing protein [Sphingopyxis sp.]
MTTPPSRPIDHLPLCGAPGAPALLLGDAVLDFAALEAGVGRLAAWLGERLEVSERTVYRDIADLVASGVPIEGEAGVGYRMRSGYTLPPLMFDAREAQALLACVRIALPRIIGRLLHMR